MVALSLRSVIATTLFLALVAGCASPVSQTTLSCQHLNQSVEQSIGFCQAVRAGDLLYISGVTGAAPMESAVPRVYEQLGRVLEANGLAFSDVVKETVYATDLDAFIKVSGSRKRYYGSWLPAATWVQVQRLYLPTFVVEVELVARYRQ